ncbi:MAG: ATP-binding protein, partial [Gemmatimonadota bacterium]
TLTVAVVVGMATAFLLLGVIGDYRLRKLVLRPVNQMVQGAERIASGDEVHRIEAPDTEELHRLARSVNEMADKLIHHQRQLTANIESLAHTNRALSEARSELILAAKLASTGQLAAGVAHEVGNPLGAILGYVEVARRRSGTDEESLQGISTEVSRIDRIVRGLLDYARPKAAATRNVDVNGVVRNVLDLVSVQGRFKGIDLQLSLAQELPDVRADPHQLEQVLVNLLLNSADSIEDSGHPGKVEIETRATVVQLARAGPEMARRESDPSGVDYSHVRRWNDLAPATYGPDLREGEDAVQIVVRDNGAGVDAALVERLFDPFFTTKEPGRGTGLGLAVCARLVSGMGGAIHLTDPSEDGAAFEILLPLVSVKETE